MFTLDPSFVVLAITVFVLAVGDRPARRRGGRQRARPPPADPASGAPPTTPVPRRRVVRATVDSPDLDMIEVMPLRQPPRPRTRSRSVATRAALPSIPQQAVVPAVQVAGPSFVPGEAAIAARHVPNVNGSPVRWRERKVAYRQGEERFEVVTPYWEPESLGLERIRTPPMLTGDPRLALGDLFFYQMLTRYQFFIWTVDDSGTPQWKPIRYGYHREDGRRLIITPSTRKPGWVGAKRWSELTHELRLLDAHADMVDI